VEQVAKTGYVCTAPELQQRGFWENNAVWWIITSMGHLFEEKLDISLKF
jgi:hypothetical protein